MNKGSDCVFTDLWWTPRPPEKDHIKDSRNQQLAWQLRTSNCLLWDVCLDPEHGTDHQCWSQYWWTLSDSFQWRESRGRADLTVMQGVSKQAWFSLRLPAAANFTSIQIQHPGWGGHSNCSRGRCFCCADGTCMLSMGLCGSQGCHRGIVKYRGDAFCRFNKHTVTAVIDVYRPLTDLHKCKSPISKTAYDPCAGILTSRSVTWPCLQ